MSNLTAMEAAESERRDAESLAPYRLDDGAIAVPWIRTSDDGTRERGYRVVTEDDEEHAELSKRLG